MNYADFAPDTDAEKRIADVTRELLSLDADHYIRRDAPSGLAGLDGDDDDAAIARVLYEDDELSAYHFMLLKAATRDCPELFSLRIARTGGAAALSELDGKTYGAEFFLVEAAIQGSTAVIARLIEAGVDVNYRRSDGVNDMTALHWAAYQRKRDAVAALLAAPRIDVNLLDRRRTTALACAVRYGMKGIVELLIDAGADVNSAGPGSQAPIALAIRESDPEIVELFLSKGVNLNATDKKSGITPLQLAAHLRQVEMVKLLCDAGSDPTVCSRKKFKTIAGKSTAMDFAAGNSAVEKILAAASAATP